MASSTGPRWPFRFLRHRRSWSRPALAWSTAIHAFGFALFGWATRGWFQGEAYFQPVHTSLYALHYLVLTEPTASLTPRPDTRLRSRRESGHERLSAPARADWITQTRPGASFPSPAPTEPQGPQAQTNPAPFDAHELAPGHVAGVGEVLATAASDTTHGGGLLGKLGFRVPGPGEIGVPGPDVVRPTARGLDRAAVLVSGTASACPELRPPAAGENRKLVVSVAFVVDTGGTVDPTTLRVVESPGRPQTEQQFRSHVYVVDARIRSDPGRTDPAAYDSVMTHEVESHVARLLFLPALQQGHAIRSSVLISCQSSQMD